MAPLSVAAPSALRVPIETPSPVEQRGRQLKTAILGGTSATAVFTMTGLATIPVGNLVVIVTSYASVSDLVTTGTVTDTAGNTWSHNVVGSGQNPSVAILWAILTTQLVSTDTVTLTYSSGTPGARMYSWYDFGPGYSGIDVSANGSAASGSQSATVTPTVPGDIALFAVGYNGPADGNGALYFNSPQAAYAPLHHTTTTTSYFATGDTILPDTSAYTAKSGGANNQSTWALATFKKSGTTFPISIIVGTVSLVASVQILDKLNIIASTVTTPVTLVRTGLLNILPTVSTPVTVVRKGLLNIVTSTVTLPVTVAVQLVKLITIVTGTVSLSATVQRLGKLNIVASTVTLPVTLIRKGLLLIKPTVAPTATVQRKGFLGIVASTVSLPVTLVRKGLLLIKPTVTATATDSLVFIAGSTGTPGIIYMNITVIGESANSSLITGVDP